jgi:hypothetical protein
VEVIDGGDSLVAAAAYRFSDGRDVGRVPGGEHHGLPEPLEILLDGVLEQRCLADSRRPLHDDAQPGLAQRPQELSKPLGLYEGDLGYPGGLEYLGDLPYPSRGGT